jgi:mannose-6-phosphate isomerase class I
LASETAGSTVRMKGMTVQHEAAEVLAVVQRACSFFPPASEPAKQLQAAVVRIRAIKESEAIALTPATERAMLQGLRAEVLQTSALVAAVGEDARR